MTRSLCAAVALTMAAGLAAALPAHADDVARKQQQVSGSGGAPSTLGSTITWSYDVNAKGVGFAAWVDGDGSRRRVLVAKRSANGDWGKPTRLSGLFSRNGKNEYAGYPDVAVDKKGRATVVWSEPKGPGVRLRVATSKGKGWSKPTNLSAKNDYAGFADVEVSDTGYAVVHWAGNFPFPPDQPFSLLTAYRQKSGKWSAPTRLDVTPGFTLDARPDSIAIDDRGLATVAWDELGSSSRIQLASRGPDTDWVQQTLATDTDLNAPAVATTADGRLVAGWRDRDGIIVQRRSATGAWDGALEVVTGPDGFGHNLFGLGISDSGRVALLGQLVEYAGNKIRPYVLVQDAPGFPWVQEYVADSYPQYGIDVFLPDLQMGRRGEVAVTWNEQLKDLDQWFRTYTRIRSADGRWKPVVRIGRYSDDPALGVDRRGRFSVVFGEGNRYGGSSGCCVALRAAKLP